VRLRRLLHERRPFRVHAITGPAKVSMEIGAIPSTIIDLAEPLAKH
jgi:hypothetical protein